jgi:hypothetical protein
MMRRMLMAVLTAAVLAGGLPAAEDAIPLGSDDPRHTFARAGHPELLAPCARPSDTPAYGGYYVGGGCPCLGGPPGPLQGTFGWDYFGHPRWPHHVVLGWCLGCRPKGGSGAYAQEGCPIPNIFSIKLPQQGHCPPGAP